MYHPNYSTDRQRYRRPTDDGRHGIAEVDACPESFFRVSCQQPALLGTEWLVQRHEVSFEASDVVGYGGCACIVRGSYKSHLVAVKVLPADSLTDVAVNLLEREAHILSLVNRPRHPNIVRFMGAWFGSGSHRLRQTPLIITELLGCDLKQLCKQTHLQRNSMMGIFVDIAYGLCYLHEQTRPIVHRDINPSNIFMKLLPCDPAEAEVGDVRWRAKIGDFGSANIGNSTSLGGGTELYMAPETLPSTLNQPSSDSNNVGITAKADVYSYGVLLLEVAMGTVPESGRFARLVDGLGSKWPSIHSLVVQCTRHNAAMRPTASEVLDTMELQVWSELKNSVSH